MKIVLIGFMGAGKTTIAKILSKKLALELIDMDNLALKKSGRLSINEIFIKDSEEKFRKLELEVAKDISGKDNVVISTGGGVVISENIMNYLKQDALVVYLKAGFDKIKQRVMYKKVLPPLFADIESAKKLFNARMPLYEKYADVIIETDDKNLEQITLEIMENLK